MALPHATVLNVGNIRGTIYDFTAAGDTLPLHDHDASTAHITIVATGACIARGPGWSETYPTGRVVDFEAGNPHEFEATQPGTRLVNIIKEPAL